MFRGAWWCVIPQRLIHLVEEHRENVLEEWFEFCPGDRVERLPRGCSILRLSKMLIARKGCLEQWRLMHSRWVTGARSGVHGSVGVAADLRTTMRAVVGRKVDQTGRWTGSQRGCVQVWPEGPCCLSKVQFVMIDCLLAGSLVAWHRRRHFMSCQNLQKPWWWVII